MFQGPLAEKSKEQRGEAGCPALKEAPQRAASGCAGGCGEGKRVQGMGWEEGGSSLNKEVARRKHTRRQVILGKRTVLMGQGERREG